MSDVPCNIEAERAFLGSVLIDPPALDLVMHFLTTTDFFREANGTIFQTMLDLRDQKIPIDFITLADALEKAGKIDEVGGHAYLTDLIAATPTSINAEHYANEVHFQSTRRQITATASKLAQFAYDDHPGATAETIMVEAQQIATNGLNTARRKGGAVSLRQSMTGVIDRLDEQAKNPNKGLGLPTGFKQLDWLLGGLQKSDLIFIGARPAMGKTSFAIAVALNAALKAGARTLIFSMEMSHEQLSERLLSTRTGVDSHRIRLGQITGEEWPTILEQANMLANAPIYIDESGALNIHAIKAECRRMYNTIGLDLVVIDYMQLMAGTSQHRNSDRQNDIAEISRGLKAMAKEFDVPVIVVSQLNRGPEARADKRPLLSDLRDSGGPEQDADVVILLYRDDYYNPESEQQGIAEVIVAKHRHGALGTINLYFRKELTKFTDLEIQRTYLDEWEKSQPTPTTANYDSTLYDK